MRAATVIIVELSAGPFQKAMVVKQFQSPQKLLLAAAKKGKDLRRTQKAMPVNQADDLAVALGKLHRSNRGGAFEPGKAGKLHPSMMLIPEEARKASGLVLRGKL
jgi:hypothetical protein